MKFSRILFLILSLCIVLEANAYTNAKEIKLAPQEIIEDYLDIADNYAFSGEYQKALEYINMVVHLQNSQ